MKKILCIILSIIFILLICGCDSEKNESTNFSQEVVIVKMPSPPKFKTCDEISVVNEVIDVLGLIEKSPIQSEKINGGWEIMIKLRIDGKELIYTIGNIFTDADGKQYHVENYNYIKDKIDTIYNNVEAPEADYQ